MHAHRPDRILPERNRRARLWFGQPPLLVCAATVSLGVIAAIVTNATVMQSGVHPAPLFETREIRSLPQVAVRPHDGRTASLPSQDGPEQAASDAPVGTDEVLREVQSALAVRGYYAGKVDGLYGSRTRAAISAFQRDHSLSVDGDPSVRLLTQVLMSASSRPAAVPVPPERALTDSTRKVAVSRVSLRKEAQETPSGIVARIQSGLRAYGYDDLVVDGKMGQHTATAIQRFQLDYSMKITGEPSRRVLDKLIEIGALNAGNG